MKNFLLLFILACSVPYLMAQKNIVLNDDWTLVRKKSLHSEERPLGGTRYDVFYLHLIANKKMKIENIYYKGNKLINPYITCLQVKTKDTTYINIRAFVEDYRNDNTYWDITQQINTPYTICMSYKLNGKLHYMGINKKYIRFTGSHITGVKH